MRARSIRRTAVLLAFAVLTFPTAAWEPETRARLTDEAVRLMPEGLKLALEAHRRPLLRGVLSPLTGEDGAGHRPPWATDGALDASVQQEAQGLLEALETQTSFATIAERFGRLAHYVMDAGFPPAMTDGDGAGRYHHFSDFCETRRERFPVVFYGHDDTDLQQGDFRAYALTVMQRARDEDRLLSRAYAAAGDPPRASAFDDRSVPFAVGSLSYSRTFTDLVRVWLAAWERASGDMGRTPYLHRSERGIPREAPDN